ncbi:hypothetical protein BGW38_003300 [Lunasporangiospora selenospora]|uniref:F-box domain-containing protein n=1 Tax=Lunasporangiospora selenospora TaxID=979761 RepID=A0A9P6KCY6_9FUNG|nr:hypothetical protein BGW38_003300 [Lunasporangiospora selenospora]
MHILRKQELCLNLLTMPEVLLAIFQCLDKMALRSCRVVSRLWRHHSDYLLSQDYSVEASDITNVLLCPEFALSDKQQWVVDRFKRNSPIIRSLRFGNSSEMDDYTVLLGRYSINRPIQQMTALSSLSIRHLENIPNEPRVLFSLEKALCELIRNSPNLKELAFTYYPPETGLPAVNQVLESTGPGLRKITIEGAPPAGHLGYLLKLLFDREQKWLNNNDSKHGQQVSNAIQSAASECDSTKTVSSAMDSEYQQASFARIPRPSHRLEELVIILGQKSYAIFNRVKLESVQGQLPIKSLSIIKPRSSNRRNGRMNHERFEQLAHLAQLGQLTPPVQPAQPAQSESALMNTDPLLMILQRCPRLEEFQCGTNFFAQYDAQAMGDFYKAYSKEMLFSQRLITPTREWIRCLFKVCPNLKKINLGGSTNLKFDHLDEVLGAHMDQLESIILWGVEMTSTKPLSTVFKPELIHRLTVLNISGSVGFSDAIPVVLKSASNLKCLLAMSVLVRADDITGFDWSCLGLEELALNILVPLKAPSSGGTEGLEDPPTAQSSDESNSTQSQANTHEGSLEQDGSDANRLDDSPDLPETISHNVKLQIEVCRQLGRLTSLREFRLEGPSTPNPWGHWVRENICMQLSMETGLPYLEPLKNSLQILDVSLLFNQLGGSQEVEWIARHWIHHRHPELHSRLSVNCYLTNGLQKEIRNLSAFSPMPKLTKLIGISHSNIRNARYQFLMNLDWLRNVCPSTVTILAPSRQHMSQWSSIQTPQHSLIPPLQLNPPPQVIPPPQMNPDQLLGFYMYQVLVADHPGLDEGNL